MTDLSDSKPGQSPAAQGALDAAAAVAKMGKRLSWLLAPLVAGCTTVVVPPVHPANPVTVYVADYGKHSSLFLPTDNGSYEEFAVGDWDFLAMGRTSWWVAARAIVRSPQATLGRRTVQTVTTHSTGAHRIFSLRVARSRADALWQELDQRFHRDSTQPYFSPHSQLYHVPDPEPYWGLNNCNHVTAEWLRKLGCQVQGPAIWSNFVPESHNSPH